MKGKLKLRWYPKKKDVEVREQFQLFLNQDYYIDTVILYLLFKLIFFKDEIFHKLKSFLSTSSMQK
jgi:hypothetical protein